MKCLLAPDSFKGSLSSFQACNAIKAGILKVFPSADIISMPLADGGEGTLDALIASTGGRTFFENVRGPLDQTQTARWGLLPDGTAIIELAEASGLTQVTPSSYSALNSSTYGTGQLIQKALNVGAREFLIGLGGSATTDGGTGLLNALGVRFLDERNVILPLGGYALARLHSISTKFIDPRISKCRFTLLCDVTNPLYGKQGAAYVYGPQKGASPQDIEFLDYGLQRLSAVVSQSLENHSFTPGSGAAGGTAFGLLSFCNAEIRSGIETVLDKVGFVKTLDEIDLIVTGEGRIDSQTLQGKTISGVCKLARTKSVPIIAFGGSVTISSEDRKTLGLESVFQIAEKDYNLDYCMRNTASLLEKATEQAFRHLSLF